jgi:hypothetical protein
MAAPATTPSQSLAPDNRQASLAPDRARLYPLNLPAWRRNARPFDVNDPRPRIAIVIIGLGPLHGTTSAAIKELPAEVTLSFDPYDQTLAEWIGQAHALGHEVMLDLPVGGSGSGGADGEAGPKSLDSAFGNADNLQRLGWLADRAQGYVGLTTLSGGGLSGAPSAWQPVLQAIGQRGLVLLEVDGAPAGPAAAGGLPLVSADLTIDARADRISIDANLAALEERARRTGFAIGIAKGYPVTIERLLVWSRGLDGKNLALAPLSAVADQEASR